MKIRLIQLVALIMNASSMVTSFPQASIYQWHLSTERGQAGSYCGGLSQDGRLEYDARNCSGVFGGLSRQNNYMNSSYVASGASCLQCSEFAGLEGLHR